MELIINLCINHLDVISFLLAIISIFLGYWFWKNPINIDFQNEHVVYEGDNIKYIVGRDHKGWKIKRVNFNNGQSASKIVSWASIKNNSGVHTSPLTLNEIDKLNFE